MKKFVFPFLALTLAGVSAFAFSSSSNQINLPQSDELTPAQETLVADTAFWAVYVKPSADILRTELSPLAYRVTQEDGTERAGTSPYDKFYEDGIYVDILSGEPLFSSRDKYDSGTGWPSFTQPISAEALTFYEDRSLFSIRTEVRSAVADNHLGHVFNDGPRDRGGLRYCMNGVALKFIPAADMVDLGYGAYLNQI